MVRGGDVEKILEARQDGIRVLKRITEGAAVDIAKKSEYVSHLRSLSIVRSREVFRKTSREEDLH